MGETRGNRTSASGLPDLAATQAEAARSLGVTPRQLRNWLREHWFPANGRVAEGYNVAAIKAARDAEGRKGSEQSERRSLISDALSAEKLKRERIETRRREIKVADAERRLIPRAAVALYVSTFTRRFGDWCDQVPDIIEREAPARFRKKIRERLNREFDQQRRAVRVELEAKSPDRDAATPAAAAAGPSRS